MPKAVDGKRSLGKMTKGEHTMFGRCNLCGAYCKPTVRCDCIRKLRRDKARTQRQQPDFASYAKVVEMVGHRPWAGTAVGRSLSV